jgi:ATP-dependent DNA helicase RecG
MKGNDLIIMKLPININDILTARTIEWERLEFKAGWNPVKVMRTMCAFANDFHNLGGGYIVIGVAEQNGQPELPPVGIPDNEIDAIQKEIVEIGYKIIPYYHPIISPCYVNDKTILVLWTMGGQNRPYKAPVSLKKGEKGFAYYIRKGATTVQARHQEEMELMSLAANIPFDDRLNHHADLKNLDLGLIRSYLQKVDSDLFDDAAKMDFSQLCRQMNIIDGPNEAVYPKNVGLMFFDDNPSNFFPQTQIDVVHFPDGPGADRFSETIFKGPLHVMLKNALAHIKSIVIEERVVKHPDRPEASRFFNYPFPAIEESLCNAVYHRSYEIREPIEVRILPDRISILSFPGPDRSITDHDIREFRFLSRRYRNRRVGEFLKELDMTEGRGTGIPKVLRALRNNGSPLPKLITDKDRTYFLTEFKIHPAFTLQQLNSEHLEITENTSQTKLNPILKKTPIRTISKIAEKLKISIKKKLQLPQYEHFFEMGNLLLKLH